MCGDYIEGGCVCGFTYMGGGLTYLGGLFVYVCGLSLHIYIGVCLALHKWGAGGLALTYTGGCVCV